MEEEADGHQREWGPNNVAVKTLACERSWVQISSWNIRSAGRRAFLFSGFLSTPPRFSRITSRLQLNRFSCKLTSQSAQEYG